MLTVHELDHGTRPHGVPGPHNSLVALRPGLEYDRQQALVLMRLMAYEVLERRVGEFRDQARELLDQFRL